ncbi:MAG TPA: efflux RND transporter periplasmic adaptor subunit [Candidatus Handelsmanbacteria bacterium]|nr:efflux RND transporter periplasmic adaptor subunit [Candidatus Handelsmanbacteria bacterium]
MKIVVWGIIGLSIIGAFSYRFLLRGEEVPVPSIEEIQAREGFPVEVAAVERATVALWREFSGSVEGIRQTAITTLVSDEVVGILHDEGDVVGKDDLLFRLARVKSMPGVGLRYPQAQAAYDDAHREVERMTALFEAGAISQQILDKTRLGFKLAEADLKAAEDVVNLKAPFDGLLIQVNVKVGEIAQPGIALAVLSDLAQVLVKVQTSQEDFQQMQLGQVARIQIAGGDWLEGSVHKLPLAADNRTRLFEVELIFDNEPRRLLPGMMVVAHIRLQEEKDRLVISKDAFRQEADGAYVWLVQGSQAHRQAIELGLVNHELASVRSGLKLADRIVVSGQTRLKEGVKVKVVDLGTGE